MAMILVIFPPKELIWMGSFLEATCIISGVLLVYGGVNGEMAETCTLLLAAAFVARQRARSS